ncbi:MAG: hypothetical protein QOI31_1700 [Solirubrobacterales bacterium]|jgi:RNA polymerase sigma-70 factor (ECF subfamily)|nr:hypothetical protein [Solirubrobacterales bacterium]
MAETCLRLARTQVRDPDDAADVAQEALLRAWRHRAKMGNTRDQIAWLRVIVRNEAARFYGRDAATALLGDTDGVEDERLVQALLRIDFSRAMSQLSESERLIVVLRYREDMTQPAIARAIGRPEGTVKVQLHRARQKLRRVLDE